MVFSRKEMDSAGFFSQVASKIWTTLQDINIGLNKIITTDYQIQETNSVGGANDPCISITCTKTDGESLLDLIPNGAGATSCIRIYKDATANSSMMIIGSGGTDMFIASDHANAGSDLPLDIFTTNGTWTFGTDGTLTFTPIADVAAAAGKFWLSSTVADVLKYSSGSTLYSIHSTKAATANRTAAAPAGTTSATSVMMAIGAAITPVNTGRVLITVSGQIANDTINDGATVDVRYGTGTAPANGDAVTGTLVGIEQTSTSLTAAEKDGFCISGVVTGLTLGTAIWVDISLKIVTGGTATATGISVSLVEI